MHSEQLGLSSGESFNEEKGHSFVKGHHWLHAFQLNLVSGFSFSSFLSSFDFSYTRILVVFISVKVVLLFIFIRRSILFISHQDFHPLFVPLKFCSYLYCNIFLLFKKISLYSTSCLSSYPSQNISLLLLLRSSSPPQTK